MLNLGLKWASREHLKDIWVIGALKKTKQLCRALK